MALSHIPEDVDPNPFSIDIPCGNEGMSFLQLSTHQARNLKRQNTVRNETKKPNEQIQLRQHKWYLIIEIKEEIKSHFQRLINIHLQFADNSSDIKERQCKQQKHTRFMDIHWMFLLQKLSFISYYTLHYIFRTNLMVDTKKS